MSKYFCLYCEPNTITGFHDKACRLYVARPERQETEDIVDRFRDIVRKAEELGLDPKNYGVTNKSP